MNRAPRPSLLLTLPLLLSACGGSDSVPHAAAHRGAAAATSSGMVTGAAPNLPGGGGRPAVTPGPSSLNSAPSAGTVSAATSTARASRPTSAASASASAGAAPASTATGACPDPRYCPDYFTPYDAHWPLDASGHAVVHYRVNPSHPASPTPLSDAQIVDAVDRLAATWHAADPSVFFVDDGTTTDQPVDFNDVVGFSAAAGNAAVNIPYTVGSDGRTITGFDIQLAPDTNWLWQPCDGSTTPCTPYAGSGDDLGATLAHAWGHAIGLGDLGGTQDALLTDSGGIESGPDCGPNRPVCRYAASLGLGDVLGARHLYPTSAAMPAIAYDQ